MKKAIPILLFVVSLIFLILASIMPVADVPIKVYDSALAIAPLCYILSITFAYLSLVTSSKRLQYFVFTAIILIIALLGMNRIIDSLYQCFEYYVHGI